MSSLNNKFRSDEPVSKLDEKGEHIFNKLWSLISNIDVNYCIGIAGTWGSGKTSYLKCVEEKCGTESQKFIYIEFDILEYCNILYQKQCINPMQIISKELMHKLDSMCKKHGKLARFMDQYIKRITGSNVPIQLYGISFDFNIGWICDILYKPLKQIREELKAALEELGIKIIIAYDDLDRVPEDRAVEVLGVINNFKSLQAKNVIQLVAYCPLSMEKIFKNKDSAAHQYFEKMIQYDFPLANPTPMELILKAVHDAAGVMGGGSKGEPQGGTKEETKGEPQGGTKEETKGEPQKRFVEFIQNLAKVTADALRNFVGDSKPNEILDYTITNYRDCKRLYNSIVTALIILKDSSVKNLIFTEIGTSVFCIVRILQCKKLRIHSILRECIDGGWSISDTDIVKFAKMRDLDIHDKSLAKAVNSVVQSFCDIVSGAKSLPIFFPEEALSDIKDKDEKILTKEKYIEYIKRYGTFQLINALLKGRANNNMTTNGGMTKDELTEQEISMMSEAIFEIAKDVWHSHNVPALAINEYRGYILHYIEDKKTFEKLFQEHRYNHFTFLLLWRIRYEDHGQYGKYNLNKKMYDELHKYLANILRENFLQEEFSQKFFETVVNEPSGPYLLMQTILFLSTLNDDELSKDYKEKIDKKLLRDEGTRNKIIALFFYALYDITMYMVNFSYSIDGSETPDNTKDNTSRKEKIFVAFKEQLDRSGIKEVKTLLPDFYNGWKISDDKQPETWLTTLNTLQHKHGVWNNWRTYLLTEYVKEISNN